MDIDTKKLKQDKYGDEYTDGTCISKKYRNNSIKK